MSLPHLTPTPTPLFGGALTTSLPSTFTDASTLRPVPDTQEIFVSLTSSISIVFDLLQRIPSPDESALKTHWEDVASEPGRIARLMKSEPVALAKFAQNPCYRITGTAAKEGEREGGFVGILMTVVRLEAQTTDLVVTVNVPFESAGDVETEDTLRGPGDEREVGEGKSLLLQMGERVRDMVVEMLEVRDWGLFLPDA